MHKTTRLLVIITGFCLTVRLLASFGILPSMSVFGILSAIGLIGAIVLLLKNGTILTKGRRFFQLIALSVFFVVTGSILKIMHWPAAGIILLIGMMSIPVWYLLHFIRKKSGHYADILKFVWVTSFALSFAFSIMHWPGAEVFLLIENVLLVAVFIAWVFSKKPALKLQDKSDEADAYMASK